ncbi:glycosyltransferase [Caproicibacter fermentans]|uniref:Glycosyltransferase n=1 Tax=Caproicibacter fermentans TaxID=2576756 RepID=A0A7G8TB43_9FIRM|nr:glycosyltransferase [Caproicibacter fermentans]QNK40834.1 glycosyltransferase [Caproicibacter fermentans]
MIQLSEEFQQGLVSVCVPVYNAEKTLQECLESLIGQTYHQMEIILIDDGSTDGSPEICRRYAKRDRRIRFIRQKNAGVGAARNAGIKASRGEFLAFADADDWVSKDMFRKLTQDAVSSRSQLVFCNFAMVKENRQTRRDQFRGMKEQDPQIKMKLLSGILSPSERNIMGSSCTVLISRELLMKHGIRFSETIRMSEDMLFVLQCVDAAERISVNREFLYFYRDNPGSVTRNYIQNMWPDMMAVLEWSRKNLSAKYGRTCVDEGIRASAANALILAAANTCKKGTPLGLFRRIRYCRELKRLPIVREALHSAWKKRSSFRRNVRPQILCVKLNADWLLILYHSIKHRTLLNGSVEKKSADSFGKTAALYFHDSSKNHGCEAIIRSTAQMLTDFSFILFSGHPEDDRSYGIDRILRVRAAGKPFCQYDPARLPAGILMKILGDAGLKCAKVYGNLLRNPDFKIAISIGGDNYCYPRYRYPLILRALNHRLNQKGVQTVLWGCSIEPKLLEDPEILRDLNRYSLITARESITYRALLNAKICKNTKLCPDPAFLLQGRKHPLPPGFDETHMIGINVSPLILEYESSKGITLRNYLSLIRFILASTDFQIALIPHVVEADLKVMENLYEPFRDTGRVILVEDHNCMELKGCIARCRMMLCARTHASIAAYSSCVPTLVVGYSVKSAGIAKDIFGTDEHYVIPAQSLRKSSDLVHAFKWLMNKENSIRARLQSVMPDYCARALDASKEVEKLAGERN